jgi:hypothetical protein
LDTIEEDFAKTLSRLTVEGLAKVIARSALGQTGGTTIPPELIAEGCMNIAQAVLDYVREG